MALNLMRKSDGKKNSRYVGLSKQDLQLWRQITEGDNILPGRMYNLADESDNLGQAKIPENAPSVPSRQPHTVPQPARPSVNIGVGLDRRTEQKLQRGQIPIEMRLDLHGMTQSEAHIHLNSSIEHAQKAGKRCLLVITGKGTARKDGGILKAMVPRWLQDPPNQSRVLTSKVARPRHGGSGALYVLLRKKK